MNDTLQNTLSSILCIQYMNGCEPPISVHCSFALGTLQLWHGQINLYKHLFTIIITKTILLLFFKQFPLPHSRGSSHGQSRAIRYSYKDKVYANMMSEAYPMWHQLEAETNTTLYM